MRLPVAHGSGRQGSGRGSFYASPFRARQRSARSKSRKVASPHARTQASARRIPTLMPSPPVVILPANSASPSQHLLLLVAYSMATIAPERVEDLKAVCDGLRLEFVDERRWRCSYCRESSTITMSTGVVELCWAASHAYITLYDRVLANFQQGGTRSMDLTHDPIVKNAMELLKWAFENYVNDVDAPWPANLLRPRENCERGSTENAADELALCATAYVIHHELAHHRLGHVATRDGSSSIEQEREADYAAAEWILGKLPVTDSRFTKRALGIATALSLLTAHDIHTGNHGGETHPRSFDRLVNTLGQVLSDDYHRVWGFVVGIINLHLNGVGTVLPEVVHDSLKSCVDSYVELLAAGGG